MSDQHDPLDAVRQSVITAARESGERYSPTRWPYTYAADFVRTHPRLLPLSSWDTLLPVLSRADASHAIGLWAEQLGVTHESLARVLADGYLIEHGISLNAADEQRYALPYREDTPDE